jgi:HlyD family type I secretion membrane fusion protein
MALATTTTPPEITGPLAKRHRKIADGNDNGGFSPTPYLIGGYTAIALVFVVFGAWAVTAPLASAVSASGMVSVESNRKTVQHLEGGIVSEIVATEGDVVNPGDVILKLDPTQALGNYHFLTTRLALLQATEARLLAENVDAAAINMPDALKAAEASEVKAAVVLQETIFRDRRRTMDGQVAILHTRIDQLEQAVGGLKEQRFAIGKQISSWNEEIARLATGQANGVVAINQLAQVTRAMLDREGDDGEIASDIAKLRQTISETQLQIGQIKQEFVERAGGDLRDTRDQLNETTERTYVAKDILDRTTVRAPVRGMLQNIRFHTVGGVIRPAEPVMDLIPLDDNFVITSKVRPTDIDYVKVGMQAEVRFSSFSARTTPAVFGTVVVVSQDVIEPTSPNEAPYYQARIEVDDKDIPAEIRGHLLPGMPADVVISTGERTLAEYVMKPLMDNSFKSMREK